MSLIRAGRSIILCLVFVMVGCTVPEAGEVEDDVWHSGKVLELSLGDIPPGADFILMEMELPSAPIRIESSILWPLDGKEDPCHVYGVGARLMASWGSRHTEQVVAASMVQRDPLLHEGAPVGTHHWVWIDRFLPLQAPEVVPVIFGVKKGALAAEGGADVRLRVEAEEGLLRWRHVEGRSLQCVSHLHQFDSGEYIVTPALTQARDLTWTFDIDEWAHGWIVVASDAGHNARLTHAGEERWKSTGQASESHWLLGGDPGRYVFHVDNIDGHETADALGIVLDLPTWARDVLLRFEDFQTLEAR